MRIIFGIVLVVTSSVIALFAQENISPGVSESNRTAVQGRVTELLGAIYQVGDIVNVDSAIGNRFVANGSITDPYNTLGGCFIFTAQEQRTNAAYISHGVVGIYKNGDIVWNSGPVINSSWSAGSLISVTRDLNDDAGVEIITSWFEGNRGDVERLWIFSWDGQNGSLINAVDERNNSIIVSEATGFTYVDVDGNNVYEIAGYWYSNENDEDVTRVIYSWNGTKYGKWANAPQPLPTGFYARDRVAASIRATIAKTDNKFSYHYEVRSDASSRQMINEFILDTPPDSIVSDRSPDGWVLGGVLGKALGWLALGGSDRLINPGKGDSAFYFESNRPPGILCGLIRGENGTWVEIFGDTLEYTLDQWYEEAKANSLKLTTIGPANLSAPFVPLNFLDTVSSYTIESRSLGWIKDQATANKYLGYFNTAKTSLQQTNVGSTRTTLQQVLQDANVDSTSNLTSEAYALIRYNTEYLLGQLPTAPPPGLVIKLVNSAGTNLIGGSLEYYDGSWKDAVNNNDGTFSITTSLHTLSLRMTYEYASQTRSNVTVGPDVVVFQTVNAQVKLQNSEGTLMDQGTAQYYSGGWRNFGVTANGVTSKELLPNSYSFRMTYAFVSNDKQQDIGANPTVVFQTINASVQLQNSLGALMDQGTVQYYSGAWRDFGTTTSGVVTKELLANNYSFRMTYAFASSDKQQNIGTNATVVFNTVNATVQLKNSQGSPIDQGTVQYYSGAWRDFGVTSNGAVSKELLSNNYTFRMTYASATNDKQQNIGTNATVVFNTVNATVQLKNSLGNLIDQGTVQYYFSSWKTLGATTNGVAAKELLPGNYTFRMTCETVTNDKVQDISANSTVDFTTVLCTVRVRNSQSQPVDGALISYYFSSWRQIGTTVNGEVTKELLPANMTFRMNLGTTQQDKVQNVGTNALVEFSVQ